jgi:cytochrome c-type biogenesis protein CcmH/NrfG
MKIGFIALAMLFVCSLLGGALVLIPFGDLFGDEPSNNPSENIPDPNEDVIAEQRKVVEENPNDLDAVLLLANILGNSGHLTEAITYYEKAANLAPDDASVRLDFARALADGDMQSDAELQFQKVLELEPNNQAALFYLAELYVGWDPDRKSEAIPLYQQSIEVDPDSFLASQAKDRLASISSTPVAFASPQASPIVPMYGDDSGN